MHAQTFSICLAKWLTQIKQANSVARDLSQTGSEANNLLLSNPPPAL